MAQPPQSEKSRSSGGSGRVAPHSLEAETAALGTILTTPSAIIEHAGNLNPEHFFIESHRILAQAMLELIADSIPVDAINVLERLRHKNQHLAVGEFEGLNTMRSYGMYAEHLGFYLAQVKRYWELRTVVDVCFELGNRGIRVADANVEAFLAEAELTFTRLAESRVSSGLVPAMEVVRETIQDLEKLFNNPGSVTGVPSGYVDLDNITSGFQGSDLIILAARPAMGKTALALNIATNAAFGGDKYVAVFSLEMGKKQLMQRMLSTAARIQAHHFRDGKMSSEELDKLYPEAARFYTDKLMLDDTPSISLTDLTSRCRKMKREKGRVDMIVIDYLQLMTAGGLARATTSRERELAIISGGLKNLAKELSCPVIALAQLNRGLEQRPDKRPKMSDLRESGSIEQDADQIMFIYRDEYYNKDSQDKGIAEVIIAKNRHGALDTIKLAFQPEFTAFHNLARI